MVLRHFVPQQSVVDSSLDKRFPLEPEQVLAGISWSRSFSLSSVASGRVVGAERWRAGGTPRTACSVRARSCHCLRVLVISTNCRDHAALAALEAGRWRSAGLELSVSVNVSATSLADPYAGHDPDRDRAGTRAVGHDPRAHRIEAIRSGAAALGLTRLRMKGFGLAIDDYGVGCSSIRACGCRLPRSDRPLVRHVRGEQRKASDDDRAHRRSRAALG
jgi:hypothetical protein